MNLFKNQVENNQAEDKLKKLAKKLMFGISTEDDIFEWEPNLKLIKKNRNQFEELFFKYLLKHYPNDNRLISAYGDNETIVIARESMYKENLLLTLGNALQILKYKKKTFGTHLVEYKHRELINSIERFVFFKNDNLNNLIINKSVKADRFVIKELEEILKALVAYIPQINYEQVEFHLRASNIGSFKYLDYDDEVFFRKLYHLDLKHGILLGDTGSGKTHAIKHEIELLLKDTEDNIIILDNDGLYEDFCKKNNGNYIDLSKDTSFFEEGYAVDKNRLLIFDVYNLHDKEKVNNSLKVMEYANNNTDKINRTWFYIEEMNEILFTNYFLDMLVLYRRKRGIITIITKDVMAVLENEYTTRILTSLEYFRLFKQSNLNKERVAYLFAIEPTMLEIDEIGASFAILKNENMKIKPITKES